MFLGSLLSTAHSPAPGLGLTVGPLLVTAAAWLAGLARRPAQVRAATGAAGQPSAVTETSEENTS